MQLRIDPEFESRIPPLTDDEFEQLEENILADGIIISPIIVWGEIIIDGHNRFRIVEKHPHIESIINMKNIDLNTVDRDELVDIRDVKVNTALPKRERALDFIRQIGNPYCYKHGKYVVKVGFSDTEVSLEERLAGYILSKC